LIVDATMDTITSEIGGSRSLLENMVMKSRILPTIAAALFAATGIPNAYGQSGLAVSQSRGGASFATFAAPIQVDGNFIGRLQIIDSQVGPPGVVQVSFIQNGKLVDRVTADPQLVFQATRLVPGTYSVVATAPNRIAAFSLTVLPSQAGVTPGSAKTISLSQPLMAPIFPVPLTSAADFRLISQIVEEESDENPPFGPPDFVPADGGRGGVGGGGGGVGGGGGGGGLAALLGVGLGGVGLGLGLSDDDDPPASPSQAP
jgi:hypothetical protein